MSAPNRLLLLLLFVACLALAALAFGPFILESVLKPLSSRLWLFLRISVLGINQQELWSYVILALLVFFAYRLIRAVASAAPSPRGEGPKQDPNAASSDLKYWRFMFSETPRDEREKFIVRRELIGLLCSAHAARNRVIGDFALLRSFQARRLPLPEGVYSFLFGEAATVGAPRARKRLEAWLRRVSGWDRAEYRLALEEFLEYIESQMEMRDEER